MNRESQVSLAAMPWLLLLVKYRIMCLAPAQQGLRVQVRRQDEHSLPFTTPESACSWSRRRSLGVLPCLCPAVLPSYTGRVGLRPGRLPRMTPRMTPWGSAGGGCAVLPIYRG